MEIKGINEYASFLIFNLVTMIKWRKILKKNSVGDSTNITILL